MRVRLGVGLLLAFALPACNHEKDRPPVVLPLAPDGVAATALTTTSVQVTWNDLSDNEAEFIVQTSPDNIVWADAETVGFNVTAAVVDGLVPGVQVFFRVAASNTKGRATSALSATATPPLPAWSQIEDGPADLFWTCSAFDPVRRLMYVFGGVDNLGNIYASLRILDVDATAPPTTWASVTPAGAPSPRFGSSLIYDPLGNRLILFGGQIEGEADSTDELWEYQIGTSSWNLLSVANPPTARQHHTAVYDAGLDRMVIHGGRSGDGSTHFEDVAALTLPAAGTPAWSSFTLSGTPPLTAPEPRFHHTAVYDGQRMVIFGGASASGTLQDIWALDLSQSSPTSWLPIGPSSPPSGRYGHVAVWDSVNERMVVYGGADMLDLPNDEVWTLTLSGTPTWTPWTPLPTAGDRSLGTAVFDPVAVRMIIFGGVVDDALTSTPETWALEL